MIPETPDFAPGCFGSAIYYREDANECIACPYRVGCAEVTRANERVAIRYAERLDKSFATVRTVGIEKWWKDRWTVKKTVTRDVSKLQTVLSGWTKSDINPYHLKHHTNPANRDKNPVLYAVFQFMIDARAFTAKDVSEVIRDVVPEITKSKSLSTAKTLCDTLVFSEIIRKEKRGLFCL